MDNLVSLTLAFNSFSEAHNYFIEKNLTSNSEIEDYTPYGDDTVLIIVAGEDIAKVLNK